MNTTMADGAEQRLDAQIAEALFGQPGMSKMDVANRVRELRGDGPALLDAMATGGSARLGDSRSTRAATFLRQYLTYLRSSPRQGLRPRWCDVYEALEIAIEALSAQPSPGGQGDAPWPEIDMILADAYSAGAEGLQFEGIARRAAVPTAVSALAARQPVGDQHPDDVAVDAFAATMKAKMAEARAKGRGGWEDPTQCSADDLTRMLRDHVEKGDPRDVANFCMMLHQRGEAIAARQPVGAEENVAAETYWTVAGMIEPHIQDGALPASVHDSVAILLDHWLKTRQPVGEPVAWYYGFSDTGEAGPVTFGGKPGAEAIAWSERHGHTLHYLYAAPPAQAVDLGMPIAMIDRALGHLSTALDDMDSSPDLRPVSMVAEAIGCLRQALTGVQP